MEKTALLISRRHQYFCRARADFRAHAWR